MIEFLLFIKYSHNIPYVANFYTLLAFVGIIGLIFNRVNYLLSIMAIEIIMVALALLYIGFALSFDDFTGKTAVIFLLSMYAIESAVVIAILIRYFRFKGYIFFDRKKKD